ncbi:hypothetical protein [Luteimonas qiangzhengi]|uniref:hypothetical protein n=1 Tax=Luteimonas sp. MJ146 TaxID=3129240 RepID=UPI0031BA53AF
MRLTISLVPVLTMVHLRMIDIIRIVLHLGMVDIARTLVHPGMVAVVLMVVHPGMVAVVLMVVHRGMVEIVLMMRLGMPGLLSVQIFSRCVVFPVAVGRLRGRWGRGVGGMIVWGGLLGIGRPGCRQSHGKGKPQRGSNRLHSSTLTSRNMPASM